jgi:hypothetical protein
MADGPGRQARPELRKVTVMYSTQLTRRRAVDFGRDGSALCPAS